MKIAVIGPGAIGTLFGGLLADADHDVWLLHHREAAVERIVEAGVRIEDAAGDAPTVRVDVPATTDASAVGHADLAIVLVKAHGTIPAVREHAACVGSDTRVLSLQNGVSNHYRLREHVGSERSLSGITRQGVVLEGPGHVVRTGGNETVLGGADGAFAERVAAAFTAAGLDTAVVEDPFFEIWEKQVFGGAIKPTAALTRLRNGGLVADDSIAAFMERLIREAATVANAEGYAVDPDEVYGTLTTRMAGSVHRSSMLQDVQAGRRTEIDDCNGAVVEFAEKHGIDVPYNELATTLVRGLERSYLGDGSA